MTLSNGMEILYRLSQAVGELSDGDAIFIWLDKEAPDGVHIENREEWNDERTTEY